MPLTKEIHINQGLLLIWELTEELEWLKQHFPFLASDKTFQGLKNAKRQKEWLAIKMMLKHIGCEEPKVYYNGNGQPHIKHRKYKHVSISHSAKLAGILLHQNKQVGLDIEHLYRNFVAIEKKYLSPEEIKLAQEEANRHCLFWCAKEAVYKTAGIPGLLFATQIALNFNNENQLYADLKTENGTRMLPLNYFQLNNQLVVYLIDT